MKVYVQNGPNKRVLEGKNYQDAAKKYLKLLLLPDENGDEHARLHPITLCSQCGFHDDILQENMWKEYSDIRIFRTSLLLEAIGRKDVAKWIRKNEKLLPKGMFRKMMGELRK